MPTSVLLAVLAAAGLLALAPALVRRYDATERLVAERALSTARVLERRRRERTVPGSRPINPPRAVSLALAAAAAAAAANQQPAAAQVSAVPVSAVPISGLPVSGLPVSGLPMSGPPGFGSRIRRRRSRYRARRRTHSPAVYRRRRVLAALVLLNVIELIGLAALGPGFSVGCVVTGVLLVAYLVHLRRRALEERRRARAAARRSEWLAAREAELRREQARRLAARREALRRAAAARAMAQREAQRLSQRYLDVSARARVRGRPYESRASGY